MRGGIAIFLSVCPSALLNAQGAEAVHTVRLETEVYAINQSGLRHPSPVAFSLSYPKGWTKWEPTMGSDNLGDLASPQDSEFVCTFASPLDGAVGIMVTNYAQITIFRGLGASAKEEAEKLAGSRRKMGDGVQSVVPVKTAAGDTGYLLRSSDDTPQGHSLQSELFFYVGGKGHIRIAIQVAGTFIGMREKLQNLVLESLRFPKSDASLQPATQ